VNLNLHGQTTRHRHRHRLGRLGVPRPSRLWPVLLAGLLRAAPGSAVQISADPCVIAAGGGAAASALYSVTDTTGQPVIGPADAPGYGDVDGFWATSGSAPVVPVFTLAVGADQRSAFATANLLAGATDADGDALTVIAASATSEQGGMVTLGGGLLAYTPPGGFTGTDAFTYTVTDAGGNTALGRVALTVSSAPVAMVTLAELSQTYGGTARVVMATTTPAGLSVALTYNGSPQPPTNAGTYTVVGTVSDPSYQGSALDTLIIHPAPVTPAVSLNDKVYDGTTAATTIATRSLSGVLGSDDVSLGGSGAAGAFASPHVGGYTPGIIGLSLHGTAAANYVLTTTTVSASASLTARSLALTGLSARDKLYDGTTAATLTGVPGFTPGAVVAGDEVSLVAGAGVLGTFADMNVGTNKLVTYVSGLALTGSAADNYRLAGWAGTGSILACKTNDTSTTTITVANTNRLDLTLHSGTLLADNDPAGGSLNGAGTIYVNPGATLGGRGRVGGVVIHRGGVLSPGASPGTLTASWAAWAGGGSYLFEMNDATGTVGADPGWDLLSLTDSLTIAATDTDRFTLNLTTLAGATPGLAVHFDNTLTNSWVVATVGGSVDQFNANKFTLNTSGFQNDRAGGTFSLVLRDRSVALVFTPAAPPCSTTTTLAVRGDGSGKAFLSFTNTSGLASVQALTLRNCSLTGHAYGADGTDLTPATIGPVTLTARTVLPADTVRLELEATRLDLSEGTNAAVNAIAIDTCGRGKSLDPVVTTLTVTSGNRVQQRFEGIFAAERFLQVINGTPGLEGLTVELNGHKFELNSLAAGQHVAADLGAAMNEGEDNVAVLTGSGVVGASALVLITDFAAGDLIALPEVAQLALAQAAGRVVISWPDTLTGWQLQASATPAGGWQEVVATPVAAANRLTVTVATGETAQFFRLCAAGQAAHLSRSVKAAGSATDAGNTSSPATHPLQRTYDGILW
jgi:hypothetical protein